MKFLILPSFLFIISIAPCIQCAKILFLIPMSTVSQKHFFSSLFTELANIGHQVTVVTNHRDSSHPNITEIVVTTVEEVFGGETDIARSREWFWPLLFTDMSQFVPVFDKIYEDPEFKVKVLKGKFDLIFINLYFGQAFYGIVHKMQSPFILLHTYPVANYFIPELGMYMPPSHVPHPLYDLTDYMTFWERVQNFVIDWAVFLHTHFRHIPTLEGVYRKHLGDNIPSIAEIQRNVSLVMMNTHFLTTYHRPLMPDIVEVGGLHCREPKPLPKELQDILGPDSSPHGFIYISFGSVLNGTTLPSHLRKMFLKVFSKLKQTVIWKWESEDMEGDDIPKNVVLKKWLPQQDILGHPNILLFISHGGLLSIQQLIYHSVPAILIPVFFDQMTNSKHFTKSGAGLMMDLFNMTEYQLTDAINDILLDPKYRDNMKRMSSIFKSQLNSPLQRAMFWTDHVLKYEGAPHLRSSARELTIIQQLSLDVIAFLILISFISTILIYVITRMVKRSLLQKTFPQKEKHS